MRLTDHDITWQERRDSLDALGFDTYQDYVDSAIWTDIRARLYSHPYFHKCAACGATSSHLHHKHYRALGPIKTWPKFIVPLCPNHHKIVHDMAKDRLCSVEDATNVILRAFRVPLCCPEGGKPLPPLMLDEWQFASVGRPLP